MRESKRSAIKFIHEFLVDTIDGSSGKALRRHEPRALLSLPDRVPALTLCAAAYKNTRPNVRAALGGPGLRLGNWGRSSIG
jgi:hypothetical protein